MFINTAMNERTAPVSVVVPCYRCVKTIHKTVASVAAQTLLPAEVLLVDDCSADGTIEALHKVAAGYPSGWIRVLLLPTNGGPSRARNVGWESATQEYIAFLDADDSWHPRKIELQVELLRSDPTLSLLGTRIEVWPAGSRRCDVRLPLKAEDIGRHRILMHNPFATSSVVMRRALPYRFDEALWRAEDYLLWAQIVLSGVRCAVLNQALAFQYKPPYGAGGLSDDLEAMYRACCGVHEKLYAQGRIDRPLWLVARVISAVLYLRRRVVVYRRRRTVQRMVG